MKFHHTGLVVESINSFEARMVFEEKLLEVFDPLQDAKLALYKNYGDSFLELIEPLNTNAFTWSFLKKSLSAYHHFCYQVSDFNELEEIQKKYKLIPILGPIPAKLFHDEKVAFFYTRNKSIVEFLIKG